MNVTGTNNSTREHPMSTIELLPPLNEDLIEILGRPCFNCIRFAQALRASGMEIRMKAEHEQAAVIHYLLGFYLKHGESWREHADADLQAKRDAYKAKEQAQ